MEEIDGYPCPHCGWSTAAESRPYALRPGSILKGRYLIGKVLGQGGFGITYLGLDLHLQRKLAIKEYYPSSFVCRKDASGTVSWFSGEMARHARQSGQDMFLQEARKMSRVSRIPEVVQVFDMFRENVTAYICMDYIDGITLQKLLKSTGPLTWNRARKIFLPAMAAMVKVHKAGVIHQDLSPDNIMLQQDGSVRILDLGAAKDLKVNSGKFSMQAAKSGFSPPEQYLQNSNSGSWTDVYAMAATMYYTLTGKLPLPSLDRKDQDTLSWDLPHLQALPEHVLYALQHAMELQISDRTQTMDDFLRELNTAAVQKATPKPVPKPAAVTLPEPEYETEPEYEEETEYETDSEYETEPDSDEILDAILDYLPESFRERLQMLTDMMNRTLTPEEEEKLIRILAVAVAILLLVVLIIFGKAFFLWAGSKRIAYDAVLPQLQTAAERIIPEVRNAVTQFL